MEEYIEEYCIEDQDDDGEDDEDMDDNDDESDFEDQELLFDTSAQAKNLVVHDSGLMQAGRETDFDLIDDPKTQLSSIACVDFASNKTIKKTKKSDLFVLKLSKYDHQISPTLESVTSIQLRESSKLYNDAHNV